jgi:transposase
LLPGLVKSYAPRGQAPVIKSFSTDDHLSVMSGVTMTGKLYRLVRDRALNSRDSVRFLKHLRCQMKGKLMVVRDGSPIHRKAVRQCMQAGRARDLQLEQLPAYAPDLNPDEGVWQQLKNVELRNVSCKDMAHLRCELDLAIRRLRGKPHVIQSFFAGAGLPIEC